MNEVLLSPSPGSAPPSRCERAHGTSSPQAARPRGSGAFPPGTLRSARSTDIRGNPQNGPSPPPRALPAPPRAPAPTSPAGTSREPLGPLRRSRLRAGAAPPLLPAPVHTPGPPPCPRGLLTSPSGHERSSEPPGGSTPFRSRLRWGTFQGWTVKSCPETLPSRPPQGPRPRAHTCPHRAQGRGRAHTRPGGRRPLRAPSAPRSRPPRGRALPGVGRL